MKDELRNVISGKSQVRDGAIIQATASFLKRSSETSRMVKSQKHYKKQETESLKQFIYVMISKALNSLKPLLGLGLLS